MNVNLKSNNTFRMSPVFMVPAFVFYGIIVATLSSTATQWPALVYKPA